MNLAGSLRIIVISPSNIVLSVYALNTNSLRSLSKHSGYCLIILIANYKCKEKDDESFFLFFTIYEIIY